MEATLSTPIHAYALPGLACGAKAWRVSGLEAAPNRMEMQTGLVRAALELEYEAISVRTGFGRTSGGSAFMDVSVEGGIPRGPHRHTVSPAIDELEAWLPIGLRERLAHLAANARVRITEGEGRWIAQPAGGALAGIAA